MALLQIREALKQAMTEEMEADKNVFLIGEEVAEYNGAYKVSKGMLEQFGSDRIVDTPITELGFVAIGVGAAMVGLRPIIEVMTHNFAVLALDQILNVATKYRYTSNGQFQFPLVMRGCNGPAEYLSTQHSQALATYYTHMPGIKVIAPATAKDSKGMLKSAIRDNNPVIVLESEMIYGLKDEVPEDKDFLIPIGKADIKRPGKDVTLITFGKPIYPVLEAAKQLEAQGIDAEVIDLRTVRPLDLETVYKSVEKTNRVVVIDESWPQESVGSYVAFLISTQRFDFLDAPVELICSEDVPMPYNHKLELFVQPNAQKVVKAVKKVLNK